MAKEHDLESWLVSRDEAKQALAAETLAKMGPEQSLRYLLALIDREQKLRKRRMVIVASVYIPLMLAILAVLLFSHHNHHHLPGPLPLFFSPIQALASRPTKLQKKAYDLLAKRVEVQALPALVNGWSSGLFSDNNVPALSVARILPLLTVADVELLTKAQWTFLLQWLAPRNIKTLKAEVRPEIVRAILLACGTLKMVEMLPQVKRLADAKSNTPELEPLKQTARNYVTLLENTPKAQTLVAGR